MKGIARFGLIALVALALIAAASAATANITMHTDRTIAVTYHVDNIPESGVVQLYHMDWGYPVSVAEWSITRNDGVVSIDLVENKIAPTVFYARIVTYDENGEAIDYPDQKSLWESLFGWFP